MTKTKEGYFNDDNVLKQYKDIVGNLNDHELNQLLVKLVKVASLSPNVLKEIDKKFQ